MTKKLVTSTPTKTPTKTPKVTTAVVAPAVVTPAVVTPAVVTPAVVESTVKIVNESPTDSSSTGTTKTTAVEDMSSAYTDCITKLSVMRQQLSASIIEIRLLQKRSERELKSIQKAGNKRRAKNATRAPSGFVKPTLISDQLATFLDKPPGSMVARIDVTRDINRYVREFKLQDPVNGRKINPDEKLRKLLDLKATDELTYFNLQRYMSHHFKKLDPVVAPTTVA